MTCGSDGLSHAFMMTEVAARPRYWTNGHREGYEPLKNAWADPRIVLELQGVGPDACLMHCSNDEIYSFHRDGAPFLFADGHVDFISATTDQRTILSLMTPNRGD